MIPDSEYRGKSLEEIVMNASGAIFNNAAQIWNHTFYWHCMAPKAGGKPSGELADAIKHSFGDFATFKDKFSAAGINQFGSGWAWLVKTPNGNLEVLSTGNAENPMTKNKTPLLTCDVWEHAYYIDTRNDRAKYINNFWELVNWNFVAKNFNEPFVHP